MPTARIAIEGDKKLARDMNRLQSYLQIRLGREAVIEAAEVVLEPMRAAAPLGPRQNLRQSIDVIVRVYDKRDKIFGMVGPTWPLGAHGHLVEHGTKERFTRKGASRGRSPGNPFVERTVQAYRGRIMDKLRATLAAGIEREAST